jgi:phage terminase Nu1 subunit (DNA packaging protein)
MAKPSSKAAGRDPLVTRERASQLLDKNVRTISRALGDSKPDVAGPPAKWRLSSVRKALTARAQRVQSGEGKTGATFSTLTAARTDQAQERAHLLRLERLKQEGKLVDADQVQRDIESDYHNTKTYLLSIPTSVVPELLLTIPQLSEQHRQQVGQAMSDILDRHIRHALSELRLGKHLGL